MEKQLTVQAVTDASDPVDHPPSSAAGFGTWKDYVNLAKPGIIFSNLIAAFGGFWVASRGNVDWLLMVYMIIGTTLVMASGCVLNNYLDREMDKKMVRTQKRALPNGRVAPKIVFWYGIVLGIAGLAILNFLVNPLAALLGMIGLFVYVWLYTAWLKRTTPLSTSIGGIAGAMPPVIGYCAVSGELDAGAWILFWILFLWQPPHFWALGIRRKEEYRNAGFPMLPVVRGNEFTKLQMTRYIVLIAPVSMLMYSYGYVGIIYLITAAVLGLVWTFMCVAGFKVRDDVAWAKRMFVYSINYLTVLFLVMIIDTTGL